MNNRNSYPEIWTTLYCCCRTSVDVSFSSAFVHPLDCSTAILTRKLLALVQPIKQSLSLCLSCFLSPPPPSLSFSLSRFLSTGAPLGSLLGSHLHRLVLAAMIYITDGVQFIGALAIVRPWSHHRTTTPL